MKFLETHFEEYLSANERENLHPKLESFFQKLPVSINDLKNIIFYGASGVGKYTQALKSIKKYSQSELKYEKKITIQFNKQPYCFKLSDIHYEIDMSLLGCNSKLLWHEIYQQITDIISAKQEKSGIILCKNFHDIHSELLESFYSYMQENNPSPIKIKFIIITEHVSFIPDNILNCCEIVSVPRPTKTTYAKILRRKLPTDFKAEEVTNIKHLITNVSELTRPYKIICDKIIADMLEVNELKFLRFRDTLYDIFIYNLDIAECVWYILTTLLERGHIKKENLSQIMIRTYMFLQYYNNNYRPIYHLESYLFYLTNTVHGFSYGI